MAEPLPIWGLGMLDKVRVDRGTKKKLMPIPWTIRGQMTVQKSSLQIKLGHQE